jgi:hypothetical protein
MEVFQFAYNGSWITTSKSELENVFQDETMGSGIQRNSREELRCQDAVLLKGHGERYRQYNSIRHHHPPHHPIQH